MRIKGCAQCTYLICIRVAHGGGGKAKVNDRASLPVGGAARPMNLAQWQGFQCWDRGR
jgi:hypothetical protein